MSPSTSSLLRESNAMQSKTKTRRKKEILQDMALIENPWMASQSRIFVIYGKDITISMLCGWSSRQDSTCSVAAE
ncbi:hypothetical protein VTN00DRAFT_6347 [Thermoascus crustaceus]|uniref:uncharacterized protein n=1 Tax=Thermoascus crustaceus TaxID=5088 RepID=UPI0037432832